MTRRSPRVTIGLPVYNGETFLAATLDSLITQTFEDFELIVCDNASSDRTGSIAKHYAAADGRIRYYRNDVNIGAAANYRRVFDLSASPYFKWAAADDLCEPEYLARCISVLDEDPGVVVVHTRARFIDAAGKTLDIHDPGWDLTSTDPVERMRRVIYAGHLVNIIFGLIRASALARTRFVAPYPGGDYRLLAELSLLGRFVELPELSFVRRLHDNASSQNAKNLEWQVEFYKGRRGFTAPTWQRLTDHFISVLRSELSWTDTLPLIGSLLRLIAWRRTELVEELGMAFRRSFKDFVAAHTAQSG